MVLLNTKLSSADIDGEEKARQVVRAAKFIEGRGRFPNQSHAPYK